MEATATSRDESAGEDDGVNDGKSTVETKSNGTEEETKLYPAVAMYGPYSVTGLKKGEVKLWCACGLSKKQPWCDGSHKGTGFKPLKWTVPHDQVRYQICACKYTNTKPECDATHTNLPCSVLDRQDRCRHQSACITGRLCTGCGFVPDF